MSVAKWRNQFIESGTVIESGKVPSPTARPGEGSRAAGLEVRPRRNIAALMRADGIDGCCASGCPGIRRPHATASGRPAAETFQLLDASQQPFEAGAGIGHRRLDPPG